MATGDKWIIPGGHEAIEVDGSTTSAYRVRIIQRNGEWLQSAMMVPKELCKPAPMRYYDDTADIIRRDPDTRW